MKLIFSPLIFITVSLFVSGCVSDEKIAESVRKAMKEDPTILADAIKANPVEVFEAINQAAKDAREGMQQRRAAKQIEEGIKNPKRPKIRADEAIRGTKGAPIVLVEYSDFECPFCTRGLETVKALLSKYDGKIQFIYKHLPLSFHPNAMLASQYYEAIRLQSVEKAFKFHDQIFAQQSKLKKGKSFLNKLAKGLKVNMGKLARDVKSKKVKDRIKEDMAEAARMGFQGTPGFIINGVSVSGAFPPEHFDSIISKLIEKGKIVL